MVIQQSTRCTYCLVVKWLSALLRLENSQSPFRAIGTCIQVVIASARLAVDCEVEQRQLPAVAAQPSDHHDDLCALAANHILG